MSATPPPPLTSFPAHFLAFDSPAMIQGLGRRVLYTDAVEGNESPLREVMVVLNDPYSSASPLDFGVASSEVSALALLSELGDARRGGRIELPDREPFTITAVEPRIGTGTVRLLLAQS